LKFPHKIILASGSPRRRALLSDAEIPFVTVVKPVDETFPAELKQDEVAKYLANKKSSVFDQEVNSGSVVITADTIVCLDDKILNKPSHVPEAEYMLGLLSDRTHQVITGVCIRFMNQTELYSVTTHVTFRQLMPWEIKHYIQKFLPFDKAGGYGIQEWIGLTGITKIEGSYFNVVGLPVQEVYRSLLKLGAILP
jgi:septum formation protein